MNEYEQLIERLKYCANNVSGCGVCEYSGDGCGHYKLLMAAVEAVDGFLHPETSGLYDIEEVHENCTVEVWKNSITGETSVGWYEQD